MARKHDGEPIERRTAEMRAEETDAGKEVVFTPVVFGQETRIRDWITGEEYREAISPTALDGCDMSDVLFCVNHEYERVPLARSKNGRGTLKMEVTPAGLNARAVLDVEGNPEAATLYSAVRRGDITGCSFMFRVAKDHWTGLDSTEPLRMIDAISVIHEVSAVNDPAYPQTSITARSKEETGTSPLEEARARHRAEEETDAKNALMLEKARNANKVRK